MLGSFECYSAVVLESLGKLLEGGGHTDLAVVAALASGFFDRRHLFGHLFETVVYGQNLVAQILKVVVSWCHGVVEAPSSCVWFRVWKFGGGESKRSRVGGSDQVFIMPCKQSTGRIT